jgi:hypothetical protein
MLANDFALLCDNFDNEWETLGFRRRVEELIKNRNRLVDFKALVRLLNFYCERCTRLGCVTGYCDNHKCATLNERSDPAVVAANKAWTAAFNDWRLKRVKGEDKSHDCFIAETKRYKPDIQRDAQSTWTALLHNQSLAQPLGSPQSYSYGF